LLDLYSFPECVSLALKLDPCRRVFVVLELWTPCRCRAWIVRHSSHVLYQSLGTLGLLVQICWSFSTRPGPEPRNFTLCTVGHLGLFLFRSGDHAVHHVAHHTVRGMTFRHLPFFMETGLQNLVPQIGLWTLTGTPKTLTTLRWGVWTLNFFPLLVKTTGNTNKTCFMALPVWFSLSPRCFLGSTVSHPSQRPILLRHVSVTRGEITHAHASLFFGYHKLNRIFLLSYINPPVF